MGDSHRGELVGAGEMKLKKFEIEIEKKKQIVSSNIGASTWCVCAV